MPEPAMLPAGYRVRLGPTTHRCSDGQTLFGGAGTVLRLRPAALARLDEDGDVLVHDAASRTLAQVLLDRGLADPWWPPEPEPALDHRGLTVVIPVLDRPGPLDRLLGSLPAGVSVVVVDDGSRDAAGVRRVCTRHGVRLVRHTRTRGPSAARNTGLLEVLTPLVAFVDSDVVLAPDTLALLQRHLSDPRVAVVAPRVRALTDTGGALHRYEAARSSLDLGPHPAQVRPHGRVSYVPSAMLLARTDTLGAGFDESMPVAEDVDLIWRVARSWRVRYEPAATVHHDHRTTAVAWFSRKACYGTGAALLAERHGRAVAPAVLTPWTAAVTAALLSQRRWSLPLAAAATVAAHRTLARRMSFTRSPSRAAAALVRVGLHSTLRQTGSALTRHYVPVTLALLPFSRRARRAYAVAVLAGGLLDHRAFAPDLDPVRFTALAALDDLAYGLGLWRGALEQRSPDALIPLLRSGFRSNQHPTKGMDA